MVALGFPLGLKKNEEKKATSTGLPAEIRASASLDAAAAARAFSAVVDRAGGAKVWSLGRPCGAGVRGRARRIAPKLLPSKRVGALEPSRLGNRVPLTCRRNVGMWLK